jgi:hypothetical protein
MKHPFYWDVMLYYCVLILDVSRPLRCLRNVGKQRMTQCHIPKEMINYPHRCENLKIRKNDGFDWKGESTYTYPFCLEKSKKEVPW